MFNLKKHADSVIKSREKELDDFDKKYDHKTPDYKGNYTELLEEVRKNSKGDAITEKQLDNNRVAKTNEVVIEKSMDKADKGINGMKHRIKTEDSPGPLMDYSIKADKEYEKEFKKIQGSIDRDTDFWDKFVGEQLLGEPTKIVDNSQYSQLLSNYENRKDFAEHKKEVKKKASVLKDADAMIYYIYRNAAQEKREINKNEEQMIQDISSGKIRLLAETKEEPIEKEEAREQMTIKADDLEQQFEEEQEIKRDEEQERKRKIKEQEKLES